MTQGAPRLPCARFDRDTRHTDSDMTNKNQQRGEKRGVLSTGRAKELDTEDADADAATEGDNDEG